MAAIELNVCRVCLVGNLKMANVAEDHLLGVYQILTSTKLQATNGMPSSICYVCYHQLHKCSKFSSMAKSSNRILQNLLHNNRNNTLNQLPTLTLETAHNLMQGETQVISIDSWSASPGAIKEEIVVVKEETKATEIKSKTLELVLVHEDAGSDDDTNNAESENNDANTKSNKDFSNNELDEHLELHKPLSNSSQGCNWPEKVFIDGSDLTNVIVHSKKKEFTCNICFKAFVVLSNLTKHMQVHSRQKPYNWCEKSVVKNSDSTDHTQKPYICNECDKIFSYESHFKVHMRIHTGIKPYTCSHCAKGFCNLSNLKMHMRVHTKEKPYVCKKCNKSFAVKCTLIKHIIRIHPEEKPFSCKICQKSYNDKNSLSKHKQTHSSHSKLLNSYVKPVNVKGMTKNMRTHTDKKPYICNECEKSFTYESHFKIHMRIHSGEKPYICNICDKAFNQRSKLTTHMRIHTGQKPYICNVCAKAFTHQSNLINHIRIHTRENKYNCKRCKKEFYAEAQLVNHIMRVHLKEPKSCNNCD